MLLAVHPVRTVLSVTAFGTEGEASLVDPADYQRTVDTLLAGGSDPVISKEPEGAWTHEITDKALQ